MISIQDQSFRKVYAKLEPLLRVAPLVRTEKWQGVDATRPGMETYELEDVILEFPIGSEQIDYYKYQIGPNLPWADNHFWTDRVNGQPLNPGYTWQDWPYALKADGFREINQFSEPQFNHTYAERYWPKWAGRTPLGQMDDEVRMRLPTYGVRYAYGDLNDLVDLLVREPYTRQAYLPVFFPEDTGAVHRGRTPCTLGYLFRLRKNELSISYFIRSCDFVRHFKDDVYLTMLLLIWVLNRCRECGPLSIWQKVKPGNFVMVIGSLHVFVNDHRRIFG